MSSGNGSGIRRLTLPNGSPIWGFSKPETAILFHEIYRAETYARHGIELRDGDTVFDVGANIGLFALWLNQRHHSLRLFLFEPLPPVFAALQTNAREGLAGAQLVLGSFGLSDVAGQADFELDPRLTFHSTMRRADMAAATDREAPASVWLSAAIADGVTLGLLPPAVAKLWARLPAPEPALTGLFALAKLLERSRMQRFTCQLRTLSDLIREHSLDHIDLVKIDVEGAEEDVLAGLESEHWPLLRQLIVEVHDVAGRAQRLDHKLRRHGFQTTRQPADLQVPRLMGISTLYAVRP